MNPMQILFCVSLTLFATNVVTADPGEEGADLASSFGIRLPKPAPDRSPTEGNRSPTEGKGPFNRLVISNATVVDGLGSAARGPITITIEGDRIAKLETYRPERPPAVGEDELLIDGTGMTVLPGFVDAHVHIGNPIQGLAGPIPPPESLVSG